MGLTYGVADCSLTGNNCELCAVKVMCPDGFGTVSGVIAGIEHAVANCLANNSKCVVNLSLGGGFSQTLNDAVNNAVNSGLHMVVAAGNSNSTAACTRSPASAELAITVGATTPNDERAFFSSYDECVDVYAPGVGITSGSTTNDDSATICDGTSMAVPRK